MKKYLHAIVVGLAASAQARHRAWMVFAVILAFLGALAAAGSISAAPAFPVKHSANQRYLVDQNGVPFPIMGRTAWFVTSLSVADYQTFIDDTAARGYSAIEFHVINHDSRGNNPPFNGNGDLPFLKTLNNSNWNGSLSYSNITSQAPDFTTPNNAYWSFVDALLAYCESKGLLVLMFPAYSGSGGGADGWMQEKLANGTTRMTSYGTFLSQRYQNQKNLVWMLGGDYPGFEANELAVESAMIAGLQSATPQQSIVFSAEWDAGRNGADHPTFGDFAPISLNSVYDESPAIISKGRSAYSHSPTMPAFLLEEPYDQEGPDGNNVQPAATQPVRRFQWWGWLSTIGGYVSGNGYVWPFKSGWQSHLNTQGAQDMARLNAFIKSVAWYQLVPSGLNGMKNLITAGGGTLNDSNYVTAAATPAGSLLVAYVPPDHVGSFTVDLTAMGGTSQARWFDPTSGAYTYAGTGLTNTGPQSFTPPGTNSAGENDWVLVLEFYSRSDFNGDGKSDILWRNTSTGENYIFSMDGKTLLGTSGYTATVPLVWTIAGTADFNGDGKTDILWRNTSTGENYIFFMDGTTLLGTSGYTATVPLNWTVAGTADFNGDGKSDILWRNTSTGENYIFSMDGKTLLGTSGYTATVPLTVWTVAGTADFNGDGKTDILWRNTSTGENYIFFMDGTTLLGTSGYTATVPLNWTVAGTADFNGDGKADILWRDGATGKNYISIMNGTTWLLLPGTSGYIETVSSVWTVAGTADFNGDGKSDILWRNTSTGENYIFFMDGTTLLGASGYIYSVATSWSVSSGR